MEFIKEDVKHRIARSKYSNEIEIKPFYGQVYEELKKDCLKRKQLFIDNKFKADNSSLFYKNPINSRIIWKRPSEICRDPKFIENSFNANDLAQGYVGNCWFIASCAAITTVTEVFQRVVPQDQTFDNDNYAGIFHFRFWFYGIWVDVCVDDRLPCWASNGELVFCKNKREPNEFWAALIEKAYAKLYGNYELLDGGFSSDALVDLTGGIQESFLMKDFKQNDLWEIIINARKLNSMIASFIQPNPYEREYCYPNGLVAGHAYTITKVALLEYRNKEVKLIRVRNPWGNHCEWKGRWSDNSREWELMDDYVKKELAFKKEYEGEFWMEFDDFYSNFDTLEIVGLTPETMSEEAKLKRQCRWQMVCYHGAWLRGSTAGGANGQEFWRNPQFLVTLDNNNDESTMIVSLMQKFTREKKLTNRYENDSRCEEYIQFRLFRILNQKDADSSKRLGTKLYASQLEKLGNTGNYMNLREITKRFRLSPGNYLIIPSCFDEGSEGEFLLRIFTEKPIENENTHILIEDKQILTESDIFFKDVDVDKDFKMWTNLLGNLKLDDDNQPKSTTQVTKALLSNLEGENGNTSVNNDCSLM